MENYEKLESELEILKINIAKAIVVIVIVFVISVGLIYQKFQTHSEYIATINYEHYVELKELIDKKIKVFQISSVSKTDNIEKK